MSEGEKEYIRRAIAIARQAKEHGNHPFGALLVLDDQILLEAENTVTTGQNPTHHAEMNLINLAWQSLTKEQIKRCSLYTSCEPCPMCTGAIFWSEIRRIVFALPAATLGEIANDKFCCPCSTLLTRADVQTEVVGPILAEEAVVDHLNFWGDL
jgi:tRNA(Arg) A34 adenosine deaminase TadA